VQVPQVYIVLSCQVFLTSNRKPETAIYCFVLAITFVNDERENFIKATLTIRIA